MTRRLFTAIAGTALAATVVGGCTFDPGAPDPTSSGSASGAPGASPTASTSPTPQDQSSAVVGAAAPLTQIATTRAPPQSALYPPLPAGTTEVTLSSPWFADVQVPVTDATATG